MRAIIMCAGDEPKWRNHLGARRHFAPIAGEPLIVRTVRQLRERGIEPVLCAPALAGYDIAERVEPRTTGWGREALNGGWDPEARTLLVYGDTVFTDAAMDTIAGFDDRRWQLFGRFGASPLKRYGEIFAISFWPEHQARWRTALFQAFGLKARRVIRRAGSWEAYRIMGGATGRAVGVHALYPDLMTQIADATDDFDTPREYERLAPLFSP